MSFQKQKGNTFEKKVAGLLRDITGDNWSRTPYSGAFLGRSNAHRADQLDESHKSFLIGDIANPAGYKVVMECKSHANFSFGAMLTTGYAKLDKWINEAFIDGKNHNCPYMLFFNITRNGDYVALPSKHFDIDKLAQNEAGITVVIYYNPITDDRYAIIPMYVLEENNVYKDYIEKVIKVK